MININNLFYCGCWKYINLKIYTFIKIGALFRMEITAYCSVEWMVYISINFASYFTLVYFTLSKTSYLVLALKRLIYFFNSFLNSWTSHLHCCPIYFHKSVYSETYNGFSQQISYITLYTTFYGKLIYLPNQQSLKGITLVSIQTNWIYLVCIDSQYKLYYNILKPAFFVRNKALATDGIIDIK